MSLSFIDYSNPASPQVSLVYQTIPSYQVSHGGIDIVENFAYDPVFMLGGTSHRIILSGSGEVAYAQNLNDGYLLEIADIETGVVYKPDIEAQALFPTGTINGCSNDAIGVYTAYQVVIIGCEHDGLTSPRQGFHRESRSW